MQKYNVGEYTDCPVFDGLYEFCQTYTGTLHYRYLLLIPFLF